jgi:hypothetical protein
MEVNRADISLQHEYYSTSIKLYTVPLFCVGLLGLGKTVSVVLTPSTQAFVVLACRNCEYPQQRG